MTEKELYEALNRAFRFGENYWADADSESYSANKRSVVTLEKFRQFVTDTVAKLSEAA